MDVPQVFKTPVDMPKAFLAAGGGAAAFASLDAILETVYAIDPVYWKGKFPFLSISTRIPGLDDWLGALIPLAILGAGAYTMNPFIAYFGLGGTLYGGGALLKDLIQRNIAYLVLWLGYTSEKYADGAQRVSKLIGTYA